ncbi:hypothetical protein BKA63DRAFT_156326 [Paraphoma chrysanthemicola]|nr:hypothetical protein BKA63DRAFT_156326 [Paraphoma chrysanthemicola]
MWRSNDMYIWALYTSLTGFQPSRACTTRMTTSAGRTRRKCGLPNHCDDAQCLSHRHADRKDRVASPVLCAYR